GRLDGDHHLRRERLVDVPEGDLGPGRRRQGAEVRRLRPRVGVRPQEVGQLADSARARQGPECRAGRVPRGRPDREPDAGLGILAGRDDPRHARRAGQHRERGARPDRTAGKGGCPPVMGPGWYLRRLSRMGPAEVLGRARTAVLVSQWRRALPEPPEWPSHPRFTAVLPEGVLGKVSAEASARLLAAADELMAGRAEYFGVARTDFVAPDWALDPKTGRRAPLDV